MTGGEPSGDAYVGRGESRGFGGVCAKCLQRIDVPPDNLSTGYALVDLGNGPVKVCYHCCAEIDREYMRKHGRITLYLTQELCNDAFCGYVIKNWPGTLRIPVASSVKGKHNWGLERIDVWFKFEGHWWWGVHIGDNSQLVHCMRKKAKCT